MRSLERRDFLKLPVASSLAGAAPIPNHFPQRYGSRARRLNFPSLWRDVPEHAFRQERHPAFQRLENPLNQNFSRVEQPVTPLRMGPVRVTIKFLATGEASRTLLTFGLSSETHGCWAFSLGSAGGGIFDPAGWQVVRNAADPAERLPIAGYDHHDWHTFVLVVAGPEKPARLYCDGHHLFDLRQPITDRKRRQVAEDQRQRHGSTQEPAPDTLGTGTYLFLESRHPGQVIDIDRVDVSQETVTVTRREVPVALDLDWELKGVRMVENTLTRVQEPPVLRADDLPGPPGTRWSAFHPRVLRDESGFHMYFVGTRQGTQPVVNSIFHAFSDDGIRWKVTPENPVLTPGGPGEWDEGAVGQATVLKEGGRFRMWYSGYVPRLSQGRAGYAESADGIVWTKPKLGLHRFGGRNTNIVFPLQSDLHTNEYELPHSLFVDPRETRRRYVLFLHAQGPEGFIVDVATSPDGLHFTRSPHNARHYAFDEKARSSTLHEAAVPLRDGDQVWAFVGYHEQGRTLDHYRMRFARWVIEEEDRDNPGFGLWRNQRIHLEPRAGGWEGRSTHISSVLPVGDEWWVYYTSSWADPQVSVGLAKVGRHRMLGLELLPDQREGWITSAAFRRPAAGWAGCHFAVNASGLGRLSAELLDANGQPVSESVPVEREGYRVPLKWRNGLPAGAGALRVRFRLSRGDSSPQVHALYLKTGAPDGG